MSTSDILETVKFVINPDGQPSAVVINWEVWKQIVVLLENVEDEEEISTMRSANEETIPWKVAKKELKLGNSPSNHR